MDEVLVKNQKLSIFVIVSIIVHLSVLAWILIINPISTKAKLRPQNIRVGVKYATIGSATLPKESSKQLKSKKTVKKELPKTTNSLPERMVLKTSQQIEEQLKPTPIISKRTVSNSATNQVEQKEENPKLKKPIRSTEPTLTTPIYAPKKSLSSQLKPGKKRIVTKKSRTIPVTKIPTIPVLTIPKLKRPIATKPLPSPNFNSLIGNKNLPKLNSVPVPTKLPEGLLSKLPRNLPKSANISASQIPSTPKITAPDLSPDLQIPTPNLSTKIKITDPPTTSQTIPTPKIPLVKQSKKQTLVIPSPKLDSIIPPSVLESPQQGNPHRIAKKGFSRHQLLTGEERYKALITAAVQQRFYAPTQRFHQNLFIRISVSIGLKGELIQYRILEKSGDDVFDNVALNTVKTTHYPPLPEELSNNPPFNAVIRLSP